MRPQCKLFMSANTHVPYPISLTVLPTTPIVCLYAFSMGMSDSRESDCSVVLLHLHVLLDVSSPHLLRVVCDTCARFAPAVRPQCKGKAPQRRPQTVLDRRLEEVAEAVGGGYCRLQLPLRLALGSQGDSGWA